MSHGIAAPPSFATRALHGAARMNASRPPLRPPPDWRPIATTAHPFFSGLLKQTFLRVAAVSIFLGGLFIGHVAATAWPGPGEWFGANRPLDAVVLDKMKSELRLTPAQTVRIAPVITAACSDMRLLSEERRAGRLALLDEVSASIAPELTPDQQRRLDAVQAEWQKRPSAKRDQRIVSLF
jgi:hypothetical protein